MDTGALETYWRQLGNSGDRPQGWFGPGGSAETPNTGPGSVGYSNQQYDKVLQSTPKAADFAAQLNTGQDTALSDYFKFLGEQQKPVDTYRQQLEEAGIPKMQKTAATLQDQVFSLEDSLRRTEENISGTTRESLVTESQRQGLVNAAQKPLIENLGWLSQSLSRITSAITQGKSDAITITQLEQSGQQNLIDAFKTQLQVRSDQAARAMTGFTVDTQNYLNTSLQKIGRGEALADQVAQRAFEALQAERQFNQQKELFTMEAAKPSNQIVTAGGNVLLIDSNTGKTIMNLGSSKETSSNAGMSVDTAVGSKTPTSSKPTSNPFGINPALWTLMYGDQ